MSDLLDMHQKTSNLLITTFLEKLSNRPVKGGIYVCFRGAISVKQSFYYVWFNEYACIEYACIS